MIFTIKKTDQMIAPANKPTAIKLVLMAIPHVILNM